MNKSGKEEVLRSWRVLRQHINKLTELELWDLLKYEKKGQRRVQFLINIYGRGNKLRTQRERRDLLRG